MGTRGCRVSGELTVMQMWEACSPSNLKVILPLSNLLLFNCYIICIMLGTIEREREISKWMLQTLLCMSLELIAEKCRKVNSSTVVGRVEMKE